jgi:aminoglycoside phosphotransferase (APT) family kinase protein
MIPIVNWTEEAGDFPNTSVEMRPADSGPIRAKIQAVFDADSVEYVGRGYNCAHHVVRRHPPGQDVIVRRMLAPVAALERRLDREFQVLVQLHLAGFCHAPAPVRQLLPGEIDGSPAFAMTYVKGAAFLWCPDELRRLGRAVRTLHEIPVPCALAGLSLPPSEIVRRSLARVRNNLEMTGPTMSVRDARAFWSAYGRVEGVLSKLECNEDPMVLVHGDLGDHNVVSANGTLVLLDWEFASVAPPVFDLMWLFSLRDEFGGDGQRHFLDGYGRTPEGTEEELPWLRRLALLDMSLWAHSGLDDIRSGRNAAFFGPNDEAFLERQVRRIHTEG